MTHRRQEYLQALWDGLTNREIGARLGVAESTVKVTVKNLAIEAGVKPAHIGTRARILRWAIEAGHLRVRRR